MPSNFRAAIKTFHAPDMLDNRHFLITLVVAFFLHLFAIYVWYLMPSTPVVDIPVRALNVKLGEGDDVAPQEPPPPAVAANNDAAISRMVRDDTKEVQQRQENMTNSMDKAMENLQNPPAPPPAPPAPPKPLSKGRAKIVGKFNVREEAKATAAPVMPVTAQQFVRDNNAPAKITTSSKGNSIGNSSKHDAEMVARYEQLISLWIQKFKVYPADARAQGMQGDTMVRIRIDRHGNIHYYELENSTGYQVLDRAAIDMIRRANPVPAVPTDYPQGDLLEFLIPVNYQLQ